MAPNEMPVMAGLLCEVTVNERNFELAGRIDGEDFYFLITKGWWEFAVAADPAQLDAVDMCIHKREGGDPAPYGFYRRERCDDEAPPRRRVPPLPPVERAHEIFTQCVEAWRQSRATPPPAARRLPEFEGMAAYCGGRGSRRGFIAEAWEYVAGARVRRCAVLDGGDVIGNLDEWELRDEGAAPTTAEAPGDEKAGERL